MKISVIIPTLNEEKEIGPCLDNLMLNHKPHEIIVVDGGSSDKTVEIASAKAKIGQSGKGRARQMNEGAAMASGGILLFLHADTRLPPDAINEIFMAVRAGGEAGRFRLSFDDGRMSLRIFSYYTRFQMFSYGDQAFFVTRDLFHRLQGFDERVPFEDIDFYKRLRRVCRPKILSKSVTTSARRFTKVGCMRQKWINLVLVCLYHAGFDVFPLKKSLYSDVR